jgi:hypothetical protein
MALLFAVLSDPLLSACRSQAVEPPPPPASYELVTAPPGARGARAAGTDAAPKAPVESELAAPGADEPDPDEEGGGESDAGVAADAAPGVAL